MITLLKASRRSLLVILPGFALLFAGCAKEEEAGTVDSTTGTPEIASSDSTAEGEPKTETIAEETSSEKVTETKGRTEDKEEPKFELPDTPIPLAGSEKKADEHAAWLKDFEQAKKQAAEENKTILLDFTGSDWCPPCIALHDEVFKFKEFEEYAQEHFVLVMLDFPRRSQLPPEQQEHNDALAEEYNVVQFPTIILADAEGKPFATSGYQPGGVEPYSELLDELLKARATRDKEFAAAEKNEGLEKAKHLSAGLLAMDTDIMFAWYQPQIDQVLELDAKDEGGLKTKFEDLIAVREVTEKLAGMQTLLRQTDDEKRIFGEFDKLEKEFADAAAAMSQIHLLKIQVLNAFDRNEEVFELAEQLAKSESLEGGQLSMVFTIHALSLKEAGRPEKGIELLDKGLGEVEEIEDILQLHLVKVQLLAGIGEVDAAQVTLKAAVEKAPEDLQERVKLYGERIIEAAPKPEPAEGKDGEAKPKSETKPESKPEEKTPAEKPAEEKPAAEKPAAEKPAKEKPAAEKPAEQEKK
ncbi:MAG: thioredoxin fold domain-containing protein [Planctomycetes bacterium]|nr:thioredoxin fold domain-containing protein [Planctomycetota bacterium]